MKKNEKIEMDMKKLLGEVWNNMAVIVLFGVTVALAAMLITQLFLPKNYESTTKMYVLAKQESGVVTNGDMEASTALTRDYQELIRSRTVIEQVIAEKNLNIEYEDFLDKLLILTPTDTRVIYITVSDEDPYRAAEIADAVRTAAAEHIQQVMNTESVNTVEMANIPSVPEGPSTMKNSALAGVLGIIFALAIVFLHSMMDDTIKNQSDVEKYLELSILGNIPLSKNVKNKRKVRR